MPTNVWAKVSINAPLPHLAAPQESVIHFSYGGPHQVFKRLVLWATKKAFSPDCLASVISRQWSTFVRKQAYHSL